ncbi:protein white-like [Coccinella septempunctata]|uniref:protein white-like n=1 Tax=Coccinella septempunctata TaxID=41139 RepID=UPI001D063F88|nr:protein white-like [Coccinella septempunctata]XP_044765967.1 protein white-like [Coccinella septempunctata]
MAPYLTNYDDKRTGNNNEIQNHITFSWRHINVTTNKFSPPNIETKNEILLRDVTGVAYPGELLVILGPSGAGKTTLLNCLTLRNLQGLSISGSVSINNKPVTKCDLSSVSAYVQQEELFIGCLTVREHLIFQALMRMKGSYSQKLERVEEVLLQLSLKDCENCQIGIPGIIKGISGGERKRLALASEFLMNPLLIFFDEPTTGLDSYMSLNVVHTIKRIAKGGRTVIATLHQPSSEIFHLIDKICLVAEGRIVFLGTTSEATDFFTKLQIPCPPNFNPADYYVQLLSVIPGKEERCMETVKNISDAFQASKIARKIEDMAENGMDTGAPLAEKSVKRIYNTGWFTQMRGLFWRSWLTVVKNPESTTNRIRVVFMESFLIFIIYNGLILNQAGIANMDGVLSYLLITLSFQEVFCAIGACCWEKTLFLKEHSDGLYRTDVYFISKIICELPMSFLCDIILTTVCYSTFGSIMNVGMGEYLTALLISVLLGQTAQGLGYIISFLAPNVDSAPAYVNIIVVPLMILGGIFLNVSSIPVYLKVVSDFSWFKYAYEAFMINLWSTIEYIPCSTNSTSTCLNDGYQVLKSLSISVDEFWLSIINLVVLAIVFRVFAFLILLKKASYSDP